MDNTKGLHPRNLHNEKYDFAALIESHSELARYVNKNKYGDLTVDFSNANVVIVLNQAILSHYYKISDWSFPKGHLCPPIPGRADYIHYIADLLSELNEGIIPVGNKVKGLDIGVGASCIYPILGTSIYGWKFIGTDIDPVALQSSRNIVNSNETLKKKIKFRLQESTKDIFKNILQSDEKFSFTICNPPFHRSLEEAGLSSATKFKNLNKNKLKKGHAPVQGKESLNFGGQKAELWCPGGELSFISKMIQQSAGVQHQCQWFTTLVSKKEHLNNFYQSLNKLPVKEVKTIEMQHGKKSSHILAWRFF